jgi:Type I restriction modification DNA specificity domain.
MNYYLPQHIDSNKIFLINHSDIEGRIDSYFYLPSFKELEDKLHEIMCIPLSRLIYSITNGYDFRDYTDSGTPYLKVANVKQGELDFSKIQYINFDSSQISKKIQLTKGNLLLTRKGTYGNAYSLKETYDFVISSEVFYIELKQDLINSDYLEIVLNSSIGQKQFDRNKIGAIMGSLSQEAVKQILIPVLSIDKQQQIVDLYNVAYRSKQSKDNEAQNLLDSIDDYLLEELGIKLPDSKQSNKTDIPEWMNSGNLLVKNGRLFMTELSLIEGGRFDATFSKYNFSLNSTKYDSIPFSSYIKINPRWNKIPLEDTVVSFIPMEAVNEIYCSITTKLERLAFESKGYTQFIENDILWAKITPCMQNGKATIANNMVNGLGFGSTEFHVFRPDYTKLNAQFVLALLHLKCLRINAMMFFGGAAGQQRVGTDFFKNLYIPFPPLETQEKIAKEIANMQTQAQKLREEALFSLQHAKAEIEQMILGE